MKRLVALMMLLAHSCFCALAQDCSQGSNIPDVPGLVFEWSFDVAEASPGQVIQDANNEIDHLFVNMEHSFMGDLTITFICPSGQSVVVQELAGGGAHLGEPVDNDVESCAGVGYDYFWSPNATNGTWAESNTPAGIALPSGTYESAESIENLNGCVVEGSWQIQIMDSYGGDNGHLFEYGVTLTNVVLGCTAPAACNFDPDATEDDGSCAFIGDPCDDGDASTHSEVLNDDCMCVGGFPILGCTNPDACNWVQGAYIDDGSCLYGYDALGVCGGDCEEDSDGDGVCDVAEILGCTYDFAANFNPLATVDDGSCTLNEPGNSGCELVYDGNGDGLVGSGDLIGLLTEFGAQCVDETFFSCGDPVSFQGYDYATVLIGEQCWFAENLRSEYYENGDAILSNLSDSVWSSTTSGAVAVYGEDAGCFHNTPDIDACDPSQSLNEYGRLYNWYAVDDARGLCPSSWHVPTDGEWTILTDYLGSESVAGGKMKTTFGWHNGGNGTNSSGFSGLPVGFRFDDGFFFEAGYNGYWWSSSPIGSDASYIYLYYNGEGVYSPSSNRGFGYAVRCVRDAE